MDRNNHSHDESSKADKFLAEEDHTSLINDSKIFDNRVQTTDEEYIQSYLRSNYNNKNSIKNFESKLNLFLEHIKKESGKSIFEATQDDVARYLWEQIQLRENSFGTIKAKRSALANFYEFLRKRSSGEVNVTPAEIRRLDIESHREKMPDKIERTAAPKDHIDRFFEQEMDLRVRTMSRIAYETALRNSDVRCLRIEDVKKDEQVIEIEQTKGGKPHTVPIRDDLLLRLDHWLKAGRKEWAGHVDSEYVFPTSTSSYLKSNKSFTNPVAKIAEKADIQDQSRPIRYGPREEEVRRMRMFTPHTLRHSIITHLKSDGVSDDFLRRFAGHVDVSTTRRYFKKAGELELFNSIRETVGRL